MNGIGFPSFRKRNRFLQVFLQVLTHHKKVPVVFFFFGGGTGGCILNVPTLPIAISNFKVVL